MFDILLIVLLLGVIYQNYYSQKKSYVYASDIMTSFTHLKEKSDGDDFEKLHKRLENIEKYMEDFSTYFLQEETLNKENIKLKKILKRIQKKNPPLRGTA